MRQSLRKEEDDLELEGNPRRVQSDEENIPKKVLGSPKVRRKFEKVPE